MIICIESPFRRIPTPGDLRLSYEHRFGALPDWLEDLSSGRIAALLSHALRRGTPLNAADVVH